MTLLELGNNLQEIEGFGDMFDFDIDSDILDIDNSRGSFATKDGSIIVKFDILELDEDDDYMFTTVQLTSHKDLNQIVFEACRQAGSEC